MPINFFPNDPLAADAPSRVIAPRPDRPADAARFVYSGEAAEDEYDSDTAEFLFWQCREAALAAVEMWDDLTGETLATWQPGLELSLLPDEGIDLNAFYDRFSLSFYHYPIGDTVYNFGAGADVVAHEAGHALLDGMRPELWQASLIEVNAFHESFGDCVAILTALYDRDTRVAVLPKLKEKNFVEATVEYLAAGVKVVQPNHNAASPRRARNQFKWQLPTTLPSLFSDEDGPGVLINEMHSFAQVFTGCFYDAILNVFANTPGSENDLLESARTVGRLLVEGAKQAPQKPRFFREVGRTMVQADEETNGGANREAIKAAFEAHDVVLGTGAMLAPSAALAGAAPTSAAVAGAAPTMEDKVTLAPSVKRDLLQRIGAVGAKLAVSAIKIGKDVVAQVIHERLIPLDALHKKLKGVVCPAIEAALIGESGGRAAVLGALPDPTAVAEEVSMFVKSLVDQGAIFFGELPTARKKAVELVAGLAKKKDQVPPPVTHAIKDVRGQKTLVRLRYACSCGAINGLHSHGA